MTRASLDVNTALGTFQFVAECDHPPGEVSLTITTLEPRLSLPKGMSVEKVLAVVLDVTTQVDIPELLWFCQGPPHIAGSACPGEDLGAQEWEEDGRLVVVGTEDEQLSARLGIPQATPHEFIAEFSPQMLWLPIQNIPASAAFGLHFIIAENPSPEPVGASAWYAVDILHEKLQIMRQGSGD